MRLFILLTTLFTSLWVHAQITVPGTSITLKAPEGFTESSDFPGIALAEKGSSIMVNVVPAPYVAISASFDEAGLKTQGMTLISREEVTGGFGEGILIHASQSAQGTPFLKWVLVFGDDSTTNLVTGTFPEVLSEALSDSIKTGVLSATLAK